MKVARPQIFRTMSNSNMVNFLHQKASIVGQMANLVNRCVSTKEIPKFSNKKSMSGTKSGSISLLSNRHMIAARTIEKKLVYVLPVG